MKTKIIKLALVVFAAALALSLAFPSSRRALADILTWVGAPGATAPGLAAQVAGTDGTTLRVLSTSAGGKLLVTPDAVALPANQSVNVAQVGGAAVALGQAAMASSVPITWASNQTGLPAGTNAIGTVQPGNTQNTTPWSTAVLDQGVAATTLSTACSLATACASTASIQTATTSLQSMELTITGVASPVGFTTFADASYDGGTTYALKKCIFLETDFIAGGQYLAALANSNLNTNSQFQIFCLGAPSHVRVRNFAVTSGTYTASLRAASLVTWAPVAYIAPNGMPLGAGTVQIGVPAVAADSVVSTTARLLTADATGILVSGPAQASTTSGQGGPLIQGAVTTTAPSYTTAKTDPLSLTTVGGLRIDPAVIAASTATAYTNPALPVAQRPTTVATAPVGGNLTAATATSVFSSTAGICQVAVSNLSATIAMTCGQTNAVSLTVGLYVPALSTYTTSWGYGGNLFCFPASGTPAYSTQSTSCP